MAAGIGLVIKIAADSKKAVGDIKDVNKALEGTGGSAKSATGILKGLGGPALGAIGAIAGAAVGAAAAMVEFGKAAWEDKQEADKLARTLLTIPGITQQMVDANEDWITQTMYMTHVMDTDLRQAISDLALVTGDLDTAQQYAVASANLATVADVEYNSAVTAVQKALAGKTTALMKMAPWLDTNKDGSLSLAEATAILTDKTLQGAAAAEAANDPWTTIQIIWDELKEALGQWLLPLMQRFGDWFKNPANQKKIQDFIDKMGDLSAELGQKLLPYLDQFLDWLQSPEGQQAMRNFIDTCRGIAGVIGDIVHAIQQMIHWFNKIPLALRQPGTVLANMGIIGGSSIAPPPSAATFAAAGPVTRTPITINFNGVVGDQEGAARALQNILDGSDRRTNRGALARSGGARW